MACVQYVEINVTIGGNVFYYDCFGNLQSEVVGVGVGIQVGLATCVDDTIFPGPGTTATFVVGPVGPPCSPSTSTTTTTTTTGGGGSTTTTSTTTTTTTTFTFPIVPVVTTITPVISIAMPLGVSGSGITYSQFLQSLGKYNYGAEFFYMWANSYEQIGQPFFYTQFDSNGNQIATTMPFAVDPYQSQPSIYYESDPELIVFTGLSSLTFNVFPNSTVYLKFFSTIAYLGNELDDLQTNNFQDLEIAQGVKFFEGFCDYLIEETKE